MCIGILAGPLLTTDRMLQFGRLCPTDERAKDDGRLIFHLHKNGTKRYHQQSWPRILKSNQKFRKAFEPDVKLARTPKA